MNICRNWSIAGGNFLKTGELNQALAHTRHSIELAVAKEARLEEGMSHCVLGQIHRARQEFTQAKQQLHKSLRILEELGSRYGVGRTLFELAVLYREQGRHSELGSVLTRAIAIFQELGAQAD